jgi:hypothetical protein
LALFGCKPFLFAGGKRNLTVSFIDKKVNIDGLLDETFYRSLPPVDGFIQFHPQNGEKATFKTQVYAFYDKKNIYFAFKCYDDQPDQIIADVTPFGEYRGNDEVLVYLDTFQDRLTYEEFAVNPRGIKRGKQTVWDADAHITGYGWSAEFKIPFKSLRFPVRDIQKWSVNFRRIVFRLNETDYWSPVARDQENVLGDTFAGIGGIERVRGGKNIELFPYAGIRSSVSGEEKNDKFAYGIDLKYGITSNLTLDLTSSPDYSEVESDPFFYQVTPLERSLEENRPFYNEGSSYFSTYFNLFYSRRISDPTLALKLTGKEKGISMGLLAANNQCGDNERFHGVLRLKKDIFKLSTIGVIYSSIEDGDEWNRNVGIDFDFKFKDVYTLKGMAAFTYNHDRPGTGSGMYYLRFLRVVDEGLTYSLMYQRVDPGVDAAAGYIPRVDYQSLYGILKYGFRWEGKWLEKLFLRFLKSNQQSVADPVTTLDTYEFTIDAVTRSRFNLSLLYRTGKKRANVLDENYAVVWDDVLYPSTVFHTMLSYYGGKKLSFGISWAYGRDYVSTGDFTETRKGSFHETYLHANYKVSPRLQLGLEYDNTRYRSFDQTIRFEGDLFFLTANYQVSKQVTSFLKFQYDSYLDRFQYDFLVGYEISNISKVLFSIKNYSEDRFRVFSPDARGIAFKFSYLIRI